MKKKNKKKYGGRKGLLVVIVVLVLIAVALVLASVLRSTGNATLSSGVNYGPIDYGSYVFTKCEYLTEDDGWDATRAMSIRYFDKRKGLTYEATDECQINQRLME